jgi:para-nitrobenzyl esterase
MGPVVSTTAGKVRGRTNERVHFFKGIPYSAPPTGSLRFKAPVPVSPWAGERDGSEFARPCPQPLLLRGAGGQAVVAHPHDEDCLALDVWSADLSTEAKQPVVVWLHGGAWTVGCSSMQRANGAYLAAEHGLVVVAVNLRLGVLGLLNLEPLLGEDFRGSGNAAVLDLVAALEWVRDNIAAFGGDPANVTIIGESGNGNKALALLAAPKAAGLFHRAVALSGPLIRLVEQDRAADFAERIVRQLGVSPDRLQDVPVEALIDAQVSVIGGPTAGVRAGLGPVLDGVVYPAHPFDPEMARNVADVPVMLGANRDEGSRLLADKTGAAAEGWLESRLRPITGGDTERLIAGYQRLQPEFSRLEAAAAARSDLMRVGMVGITERIAEAGRGPAYLYLFSFEVDEMFKAAHAAGVGFFFGNVEGSGSREDRFELAKQITSTLASFARTGEPSHPRIGAWPAFSTATRDTMVFDVPCRIEPADRDAIRIGPRRALLGGARHRIRLFHAGLDLPRVARLAREWQESKGGAVPPCGVAVAVAHRRDESRKRWDVVPVTVSSNET